MKKLLSIFSALAMLIALPAKAEFSYGISVILGSAETDGSETEKTVSGVTSEVTKKSVKENFIGGSIFAEYDMGGYVLGVDYVPLDIELGSGKRTDVAGLNDDQSGTRTAEAKIFIDLSLKVYLIRIRLFL